MSAILQLDEAPPGIYIDELKGNILNEDFYGNNGKESPQPDQVIIFIGRHSKSFCQELIGRNYTGLAFKNWTKALEWLTYEQNYQYPLPAAIIFDAHIIGENSIESVKQLKKLKRMQAVPVIMIGVQNTTFDLQSVLESGVDDYFMNDLHVPDLLYRIKFLNKIKKLEDQVKTKYAEEEAAFIKLNFERRKRKMDVIISSILLVLFSPLLLLIALFSKNSTNPSRI